MYKFILLSCLTCGAVNAATTEAIPLSSWVRAIPSIEIRTMKNSLEIPITADTTVETVKSWIQENEGIPVDQQNIYLVKTYYQFWKDNILLSDDTVNLKSAMYLYNANDFMLRLHLRRSQNQ